MITTAKENKDVLIVEDEYVVARNLKMIVEKLGYGILGVTPDGSHAIKLMEASESNPELVLMDITLSGPIDGIETAKIIQNRYDTPIIYITGNKDQGTVQRAVEETLPLALLNKPFNVDKLKSLITDTLDPDSPNPEKPDADNNRISERLPIPTNENAPISIRGSEIMIDASLKNLSMSGAGILSRGLLFSIENVVINISPQNGMKEIQGICHVRHMSMVCSQYYYGVELEMDRENQKNLASYYSYLNNKWHMSN